MALTIHEVDFPPVIVAEDSEAHAGGLEIVEDDISFILASPSVA